MFGILLPERRQAFRARDEVLAFLSNDLKAYRAKKDKSSHSSAVRTAMLEVESTVAASQDAYRTASAAYGSPINIPQTATVQPLQQLQQSQSAGIDKVIRTSASSPSPSSSASSSTANRKLDQRK